MTSFHTHVIICMALQLHLLLQGPAAAWLAYGTHRHLASASGDADNYSKRHHLTTISG
jgi:hypothetical protein